MHPRKSKRANIKKSSSAKEPVDIFAVDKILRFGTDADIKKLNNDLSKSQKRKRG